MVDTVTYPTEVNSRFRFPLAPFSVILPPTLFLYLSLCLFRFKAGEMPREGQTKCFLPLLCGRVWQYYICVPRRRVPSRFGIQQYNNLCVRFSF